MRLSVTSIQWLCLLVAASLLVAGSADKAFVVPKGNSVSLDGKLIDEEWQAAARYALTGGGELRLTHDGAHLYVGLRGLRQGWAHVYVSDGKDIYALHASHALGTAIYRRQSDGRWTPVQPFNWGLRDTSLSEKAVAARSDFLNQHGWVASTMEMGQLAELEFKIADRFRQGKELSLAIVFASDEKSFQYWPATLKDDCLKPGLVVGNTPPALKFNQRQWARLELAGLSDSAPTQTDTASQGAEKSWETFEQADLLTRREKSKSPWLPFLEVPTLSMGLYALTVGATDNQPVHDQDEVYYIVKGRATLRIGADEQPVQPGSLVFVKAGIEHRFHTIKESLEVLVFFSAAKPSEAATQKKTNQDE